MFEMRPSLDGTGVELDVKALADEAPDVAKKMAIEQMRSEQTKKKE
jgi:hypothetical protein